MTELPLENAVSPRNHGGNLSAAMAEFGGTRSDWIDLSTGINPQSYPLPGFTAGDWGALPDADALANLERAARSFWNIPDEAAILAAPGASAMIAALPALAAPRWVQITKPTYNEHAAAFEARGWKILKNGPAEARVVVHPNNPDGRLWSEQLPLSPLTIIDESFCDIYPDQSLIRMASRPGVIILKSFGKFWGLAGLRLGFAIGDPKLIAKLSSWQGPWAVSGPALRTGALALQDHGWANATRRRLKEDSARLDQLVLAAGASLAGGTDLFRLYNVEDATVWQRKLARARIWSRIFPYSKTHLRLGLPPADGWDRLEAAL